MLTTILTDAFFGTSFFLSLSRGAKSSLNSPSTIPLSKPEEVASSGENELDGAVGVNFPSKGGIELRMLEIVSQASIRSNG